MERFARLFVKGNKEQSESDSDKFRILISQDIGDKRKLPLFDTHFIEIPNIRLESRSAPNTLTTRGTSWSNRSTMNSVHTMPLSFSKTIKKSPNMDLLGDMMFGTVPLSFKALRSCKIHFFKSPEPQIVITKLFTLPDSIPDDNESNSTVTSRILKQFSDERFTRSVPIYEGTPIKSDSQQPSSPTHSTSSRTTITDSMSVSLLQRKTKRFTFDDTFNENQGENIPQKRKPTLFAVALIVNIQDRNDLRDMIFSHFALIERRIQLLKAVTIECIMNSLDSMEMFTNSYDLQSHQQLKTAVDTLVSDLNALINSKRIASPLWLDSQTFPGYSLECSRQLNSDLQFWWKMGSKQRQFLSDFITALLSFHLGWTFTIASRLKESHVPRDSTLNRGASIETSWTAPYNSLMAQLTDLYGLVGFPSRVSRTIILSSSKQSASLLRIASYFIRCGQVFEQVQKENEHLEFTGDCVKMSTTSIISRIPDPEKVQNYYYNSLGRSLLMDHCTIYCPDAALIALESFNESRLRNDLIVSTDLYECSASACILVDCAKLTCNVYEYDKFAYHDPDSSLELKCLNDVNVRKISGSDFVYRMLDNLSRLFCVTIELVQIVPPEITNTFIEDQLQDLYNRVALIKLKMKEGVQLFTEEMKLISGYHPSDLELLNSSLFILMLVLNTMM